MIFTAGQRGQALILLATWLFFGGGAATALVVYDRPVSELKQAVEQVIADGSQKNSILALIRRWESDQEKRNEVVERGRAELLKMLRDQGTLRSQLEPIEAKLDDNFLVMDSEFLDLQFRVKAQVTASEWARISARPKG